MKNILLSTLVVLITATGLIANSQEYSHANYLLKKAGKSSSQKEVTTNILEATRIFTKLCKSGDVNGCKSLGQLGLLKITSFAKDSEDILKIACESKNPDIKACAILSDAYFHGVPKAGIKKNVNKGLELLIKSCDLNNQSACFALGNRYLKGDGVNKNTELGKNKLSNSCKMGYADSCIALSFMHIYGTYGTKKDYKKAEKSLINICDTDNKIACVGLGEYFSIIKEDTIQAEKYFKKACALGSGQGCHRLAKIMSLSEKDAGKPNTMALIEKSCNLGYTKACTILSSIGIK